MENPIDKLLDSKFLKRMRFGGFVGKLVLLGAVAVLTIGALGVKAGNSALAIYAILVALGLCVIPSIVFAFKHPQLATLEGAEIITYTHMQHVAAKKQLSESDLSATPVLEGTERALVGALSHDDRQEGSRHA